jgi:hypothetical protein
MRWIQPPLGGPSQGRDNNGMKVFSHAKASWAEDIAEDIMSKVRFSERILQPPFNLQLEVLACPFRAFAGQLTE